MRLNALYESTYPNQSRRYGLFAEWHIAPAAAAWAVGKRLPPWKTARGQAVGRFGSNTIDDVENYTLVIAFEPASEPLLTPSPDWSGDVADADELPSGMFCICESIVSVGIVPTQRTRRL